MIMRHLFTLFCFVLLFMHVNAYDLIFPKNSEILPLINSEACLPHKYVNLSGDRVGLLTGNICVELTDDSGKCICFPDSIYPDDINVIGDVMFISSENTLYYKSSDKSIELFLSVENARAVDFEMDWPNGVYCVEKGDSIVRFWDFASDSLMVSANIGAEISQISICQDGLIAAYDDEIAKIERRTIIPLTKAEGHINCFALLDEGAIIYGTDAELVFQDGNRVSIVLADIGVSSMLLLNNQLFVVFIDNSSIVVDNISELCVLSTKMLD